jgi:hypothetical protein
MHTSKPFQAISYSLPGPVPGYPLYYTEGGGFFQRYFAENLKFPILPAKSMKKDPVLTVL